MCAVGGHKSRGFPKQAPVATGATHTTFLVAPPPDPPQDPTACHSRAPRIGTFVAADVSDRTLPKPVVVVFGQVSRNCDALQNTRLTTEVLGHLNTARAVVGDGV